MARKPSSRVVLNRSKLTELGLAVAYGLEEVLKTVIETADPPDATPYGQGLVTRGGWLVYQGANKVAGGSQAGYQPKKPRAFRVRGREDITGMAGFGFPGRFQNDGTIHNPATGFFDKAVNAVVPHAGDIMASVVGPRSKKL